MAQSELEIKITWENDNFFQMTAKKDAGDVKTVLKSDENGQLAHLWGGMKAHCLLFIDKEFDNIGNELKG